MPEGPEVKTVARTLSQHLVGQTLGDLWHSPLKLRRFPNYEALKKLKNTLVDGVDCYGKILFIYSNNKPVIMAQLGMTGQLKVENTGQTVAPHTHIRWGITGTKKELRYVDPRRFGLVDICSQGDQKALINKLGPDPFHLINQQRSEIITSIKRSARSIKDILLDQSVVVGVGNIYASEALFLASINPARLGCELAEKELETLLDAVVKVLHLAYENCGTSFSNYVDGSGKKGNNLDFLKVFMREHEPCLTCAQAISRIKQSGRSTFYCTCCQK